MPPYARGPRGCALKVQLFVIAPSSTSINTDMNLPHPIAGSSKKRKNSAAESRDKGAGLGEAGPGDLDGPQPAPAYRDRSQGQEFDDLRKVFFWSTS